ncbi:MAG: prepilin-type N-terminal cleavage/methylation domain-containing protein [Gammaproteobacteria bacterium]|nr:prepilin-type N-terminal cleavage/methylation domain-containing protein [Gammaproteobacteria bacterium]
MNTLIIKHPASNGFSLIELLVALSIAAIILAVSPSITSLIHTNKTTAQIHEFATSLNFARSEAIKRGNAVTVCRTQGNPQCDGPPDIDEQKVWNTGWMVFSDINGNGQYNPPQDQVLRQHSALPDNYSLRSSTRIRITYQSVGISPGFMDTWILCGPGGNPVFTRGLVLAYSGRVRFAQDSNGNGTRDNGTSWNTVQPKELICTS